MGWADICHGALHARCSCSTLHRGKPLCKLVPHIKPAIKGVPQAHSHPGRTHMKLGPPVCHTKHPLGLPEGLTVTMAQAGSTAGRVWRPPVWSGMCQLASDPAPKER